MRNPLKNEETAFRFVLGTIAYFALIVARLLDCDVARGRRLRDSHGRRRRFVARREEGGAAESRTSTARTVEDTRRILVIANETLTGARLRDEIVRMADGVAEDVLVVCPALNSHLRTWTSDEDGAREAARRPARRRRSRLSGRRASMCAARSATVIRCRLSRTRCGDFPRTRS